MRNRLIFLGMLSCVGIFSASALRIVFIEDTASAPAARSWTDPNAALLLVHLNMEATNATQTLDVSGNNYHANLLPTPGTGPTWHEDYYTNENARGESLYETDGNDDKLDCGLPIAWPLATNWSMSVWAKWKDESVGYPPIVDCWKYQTSGFRWRVNFATTDQMILYLGNSANTLLGNTVITTQVWHHVALTHAKSGGNADVTMYLDGAYETNKTITAGVNCVTNMVIMGQNDANNEAKVWIDDYRYYLGVALTAADVTNVWHNTAPTNCIEVR